MHTAQKIVLRSFAKINLGLHVLGKREDGYHELRTLFQVIDFHDLLTIERTRKFGIDFESDSPGINPQSNLVVDAIQAVCRLAGFQPRFRVRLKKKIPLGGGMGGGSSNAASVIWGLNRLLKLNLPIGDMLDLGGGLGSDICFFLVGGLALGIGRGSEVYPLPDLPRRTLLLAVPSFPVSTPHAYSRLSLALTKTHKISKIPVFCSDCLDYLGQSKQIRNDFEQVVFEDYPSLRRLRGQLLKGGAEMAAMTGSGSVVYGVFNSRQVRDRAISELKWKIAQPIATQTLTREEYFAQWVAS